MPNEPRIFLLYVMPSCRVDSVLMFCDPKGPCTQIVYTLAPKYLYTTLSLKYLAQGFLHM